MLGVSVDTYLTAKYKIVGPGFLGKSWSRTR